MAAPLCRYCGKQLKRKVTSIYFLEGARVFNWGHGAQRDDRLETKDEAQKLFNEQIVGIRYLDDSTGRYVARVDLWDGESYVDKFFCKNDHAQRFAYAAMNYEPTLGTKSYRDALEKQEENLK